MVLIREDSNHLRQFRKGYHGGESRVGAVAAADGVRLQSLGVRSRDMGVFEGGRRGLQFEVWKRRCQMWILAFGILELPLASRRMGVVVLGFRVYVRTPLSIGRRRRKIRKIVDLLACGGGRLRRPGRD